EEIRHLGAIERGSRIEVSSSIPSLYQKCFSITSDSLSFAQCRTPNCDATVSLCLICSRLLTPSTSVQITDISFALTRRSSGEQAIAASSQNTRVTFTTADLGEQTSEVEWYCRSAVTRWATVRSSSL